MHHGQWMIGGRVSGDSIMTVMMIGIGMRMSTGIVVVVIVTVVTVVE